MLSLWGWVQGGICALEKKNRFHFGIILFPRVKVIMGSLNMVLQDLLFLPSLGRMPQNPRLPPCPSPSGMAFIISSFRDGWLSLSCFLWNFNLFFKITSCHHPVRPLLYPGHSVCLLPLCTRSCYLLSENGPSYNPCSSALRLATHRVVSWGLGQSWSKV